LIDLGGVSVNGRLHVKARLGRDFIELKVKLVLVVLDWLLAGNRLLRDALKCFAACIEEPV
jgi:hypothetical protein